MKVRATVRGEYGSKIRERGDVFTLEPREAPIVLGYDATTREPILKLDAHGLVAWLKETAEAQFEEAWMERVPDDTPEKSTTAQEALNRDIDERMGKRA